MSSKEQVLTQEEVVTQDAPTLTDEDMQAAQAAVADAVLKSEHSWGILREMHRQCATNLLTTQGFTLPVIKALPTLRTKLSDPEAFERSFNTLLGDIKSLKEDLDQISLSYKDRSGVPSEQDWPEIFAISQQYSNLLTRFDQVIVPLTFSLIEIIKKEHGELIQLPS